VRSQTYGVKYKLEEETGPLSSPMTIPVYAREVPWVRLIRVKPSEGEKA
jgi:hypothetical protein